jgi:hypothetical protein
LGCEYFWKVLALLLQVITRLTTERCIRFRRSPRVDNARDGYAQAQPSKVGNTL